VLQNDASQIHVFTLHHGVLLSALKHSNQVLLDDLNLAPLSVLEGLNSCLDHCSQVIRMGIQLPFNQPGSFTKGEP
jgi:midasin (ATPase involved in ribosome maturation)